VDTSLIQSTALDELSANALDTFSPSARAFKEGGGRIVGLLYNYVPEEILTAAGLLSYRVRAVHSTQTVLAESRFTEINCPLVRHFYDSAARGHFDFLDGLASTNSCDHERRLFDNWVAKLRLPHSFFLTYPKKQGPEQVEKYTRELRAFRRALEQAYDVEITDGALAAAIDLHNETRALQRGVYDLMKRDRPPLTGAQVLTVMLASTTMPKTDYDVLLGRLLADCADAEGGGGDKVRLLMYGGEIDSIPLVELIEEQGALVTGDSLGYGYRNCAVDVTQTGQKMSTCLGQLLMVFIEFGSSGGLLIQAAVGRACGMGWWRTNRSGWAV
jgi:benzoyl-CoA reductase subunit C